MAEKYVTSIPVEIKTDYRPGARVNGQAPKRRFHMFPQADGSTIQCVPSSCRECRREREGYER